MRIRKRQVPFPLLPVTNSDPNLINRSPVMVQLNDAITTSNNPSCTRGSPTAPSPLLDSPQPFDQLLPPIGKPIDGSDESPGEGGTHHKKHEFLVEDVGREEGRGQKSTDTRKGSISCSETLLETLSSSSPLKQDENWCEGEKSFPLKKRRGRMENVTEDSNNDDYDDDNNNGKKKPIMGVKRMKMKMNKKYSRRDNNKEGEEEEEDEEEEARETKPQVNVGKKRVRGGALMEGSRCSRVNGRGWRCCQQTLVGYSLCEHHLGKGRLRSMTSVRNKSIGTSAPKNNNNNMLQSETLSQKQTPKSSNVTNDPLGSDAENSDEKKPLVVTKKRMKLGMVKARSISSLLGQTNTEIIAVAENNNDKK